MKEVVVIFLIVLIHGNDGSLYVQGPGEVLEGALVELKCMSTDPGVDLTQFHLRRLRYKGRWDPAGNSWCMVGEREKLSNTLTIAHMHLFWNGAYACVSNNATAPDNSSQPMTLKMQYMKTPTIQRQGRASRFLGSLSSLEVRLGEDVVMDCSSRSSETPEYSWSKKGEDWIVASSKMTLRSVQAFDGGLYTCTAKHPTGSSLRSSQTISITVLPEDSYWYETTNGRIVLTAAAAGAALLVLIVTMGALLVRKVRRAKQAKGPIDDHSQKKPIYKGSAESLPASITGDTQPLV